MIGAGRAFVDVQNVALEISAQGSWLSRITGSTPPSHSILQQISFQLALGDQVVLFGAEGSGKTSLLRLLTGIQSPTRGQVIINGRSPAETRHVAAGYVSSEESEPMRETPRQILHAFCSTHGIAKAPGRIRAVSEAISLNTWLDQPTRTLSSSQRVRLNLARAALSEAPLILLDDTADHVGVPAVRDCINRFFAARTVIIATRFPRTAEELDLPVMLLHAGTISHFGTRTAIAGTVPCPRLLTVWIEGLQYSVLRQLRQHPGIIDVRLVPNSQFSGQCLRITARSSRYLPALYDLISHTPLVRVEEEPPSITDLLKHLP